jgi:hypothetical protein
MTEDLEYCDAIYRRFIERRAHSLMLTMRDWDQILTWRERDIPLPLVLRVIDRHVEHSDGQGRPLRLTELGPLVRSAWLELRKAQVGREEADDAELASFTLSFALSRILEPAAERLREPVPPGPVGEEMCRTLDDALGRMRKRQLTGLTAEELLRWESRLNRKLLEAAEQAAGPELLEQARQRAQAAAAEAQASPAGATLHEKLYQLTLRRLLGVPRLRLFEAGPN